MPGFGAAAGPEGTADDAGKQLRELQHRFKNNMQLILSLLRLQAKRAQEPETRRQLEEAAMRVHAITLAQGQMQPGDDADRLDFGEFLRQLVGALRTTYGRPGIEISLQAGGLAVAGQRAVPLGLVASELITNACRHAFPEGREGRVEVAAGAADGAAVLTVADDGVGLAPDMFPGKGSLGFQLISGLAGQAGATVRHETSAAGARFVVEFPAE